MRLPSSPSREASPTTPNHRWSGTDHGWFGLAWTVTGIELFSNMSSCTRLRYSLACELGSVPRFLTPSVLRQETV